MNDKDRKLAQFVEITQEDMTEKRICQWVNRCYESGRTVVLRVKNEKSAGRLDGQLWTFEDMGFVPHAVFGGAAAPSVEPVLICPENVEPPGRDVLIEASAGEPCPCFKSFNHVIDFAEIYDEQLKEAARRRYKAYKAAGYNMRMIRENDAK